MNLRQRLLALATGGALLAGGLIGAPPAVAGTVTSFTTTDSPVAIPDATEPVGNPGAPVSQQVQVSGLTGVVEHVEVGVTISHPFAEDVALTVTAPDGTSAFLSRNSSSGSDDLDGHYTFTDSASQTWADATASDQAGLTHLPEGSYLPSDNGRTYGGATRVVHLDATFAGARPNGTWTITARDLYQFDVGTLTSADLTITDAPADTTGPTVSVTSGPADGATVDEAPSYGFSSPDADIDSFQCAVDDGEYSTCTSPYTLSVTEPGQHTFSVRGIDASQNVGTAATRAFTLRDVACDDATDALEAAQVGLGAAKDKVAKAKVKLAKARDSGDPVRIKKAKKRLAEARAAAADAADAVTAAQQQVDQVC